VAQTVCHSRLLVAAYSPAEFWLTTNTIGISGCSCSLHARVGLRPTAASNSPWPPAPKGLTLDCACRVLSTVSALNLQFWVTKSATATVQEQAMGARVKALLSLNNHRLCLLGNA
jgi:hypothetical protein